MVKYLSTEIYIIHGRMQGAFWLVQSIKDNIDKLEQKCRLKAIKSRLLAPALQASHEIRHHTNKRSTAALFFRAYTKVFARYQADYMPT